MKNARMYTRKFLNKDGHHTVGYILALVGNSEEGNDEILLTIGDCKHQITLDFPLYNPEDRKNSLYKANLLLDTLTDFRDALQEEADRAAAKKRGRGIW